ncbi:hypothetical protein CSW59_00540 [Caulobacter sp. BP25]|nr:hypothetical protein CSW59_00540 [Caulobacter sp. BP25]
MPHNPISEPAAARREAVLAAARKAGLLSGQSRRIGARLALRLVEEAKGRSGTTSTTRLLEYALAKVALDDGLGTR